MEALFRQVGIYSHVGQLYEPVDMDVVLYYKEAKEGQILEEGITEAGLDLVVHRRGQRLRDARHQHDPVLHLLLDVRHAARRRLRLGRRRHADAAASCSAAPPDARRCRAKGCSTRTATAICSRSRCRTCKSYDPAFAYELAVIIEDGIKRMYKDGESLFYYLTVMNEPYEQPPMPDGVRDGILKGMYKFRASDKKKAKARAQLLGSGAILNEVLAAQQVLAEKYDVAADVWSVTSYPSCIAMVTRWSAGTGCTRREKPRVPYVTQCLGDTEGVIVAASDYVKLLPNGIDRWTPRPVVALGTDGFGRSEGRASLRDFFEVDTKHIVAATLSELAREARSRRRSRRRRLWTWGSIRRSRTRRSRSIQTLVTDLSPET